MIDRITGEIRVIVVFVAILPYSQRIYAEGMLSTKEPEWIKVNNHALDYFGGVPAIVVPDNCKQAVIANKDWIEPELNQDYAEWAEHNKTAILPAKVRRPKFKSHVEGAVKILEQGLFHILEERQYFSLEDFNDDLWEEIDKLNDRPFTNKEHSRNYYWEEEKQDLMHSPPCITSTRRGKWQRYQATSMSVLTMLIIA
jgi:transposase